MIVRVLIYANLTRECGITKMQHIKVPKFE